MWSSFIQTNSSNVSTQLLFCFFASLSFVDQHNWNYAVFQRRGKRIKISTNLGLWSGTKGRAAVRPRATVVLNKLKKSIDSARQWTPCFQTGFQPNQCTRTKKSLQNLCFTVPRNDYFTNSVAQSVSTLSVFSQYSWNLFKFSKFPIHWSLSKLLPNNLGLLLIRPDIRSRFLVAINGDLDLSTIVPKVNIRDFFFLLAVFETYVVSRSYVVSAAGQG